MTREQFDFVNGIRMAHSLSPLAKRYNDTGPEHQARQIRRALLVCSPIRRVTVNVSNTGVTNVIMYNGSGRNVFLPLCTFARLT